ncbi:MAG: molybdenum cofactor biosynthesis protein MoaB [Nitrospirae bacterium]|nr:molybdenum cofactor biosynthesis protein MoaB [Nitrospirota bacterium]MBI3351600.1 molybdenum cofactor biosynthesis protein MoaB [Nitrospirota bacterium]
MGYQEHREKAFKEVRCAVMAVSDSRTPETDTGGKLIIKCLQDQSHSVLLYRIVKDVPQEIQMTLEEIVMYEKIQAVILTGGTGLSRRDVTYETIENLMEKQITGFGELFRYLSYQEIGPAAMMSRATAGIYQGKLVFSLPGSEAAVRLAMEKLILPELGHMVWDVSR